ncbi:hypothetical protein D9M73_114920 [compost metagenome]
MRGRQQGRGRRPPGQRRAAIPGPLLPVAPAMRVEQFVAERPDHVIAERLRPLGKVALPRRRRHIQRAPRQARIKAARIGLEPQIMAHPQIMDDASAIAQQQRVAQQPRGRQVVTVVIATRDLQTVLGHHHIANRQHRPRPVAHDLRQLDPRLDRARQRRTPAIETGRHQRYEHPVDIPRPHRIGLIRQHKPTRQVGKVDRDGRILGRSHRIIPQSHIPGARRTTGIAPLDRQHRAVDRIERHHPRRSPAEPEPTPAKIACRLIAQQRMIVAILRFPDQPRQIARGIEHRIDAQRIRRAGRHRRHHRPRKIDRPKARIEPRHDALDLNRALARQPKCHLSPSPACGEHQVGHLPGMT